MVIETSSVIHEGLQVGVISTVSKDNVLSVLKVVAFIVSDESWVFDHLFFSTRESVGVVYLFGCSFFDHCLDLAHDVIVQPTSVCSEIYSTVVTGVGITTFTGVSGPVTACDWEFTD